MNLDIDKNDYDEDAAKTESTKVGSGESYSGKAESGKADSGKEESAKALIQPVIAFLTCRTPIAWLEYAVKQEAILLVDHAHCEKKAASTALTLIYRYTEKQDLLFALSQLAREELLHFEQVLELINKRGHKFDHIKASRYAGGLHCHASKEEPQRLIDALIMGAIIEARSCERFYSLCSYVDDTLATYYRYLLKSESRHFEDYLNLAQQYALTDISERVDFFLAHEQILIESDDAQFRFHSGVPVNA